MWHRPIAIVIPLLLASALSLACERGSQSSGKPPAPEVVVETVEQKAVEISSEWVGTTVGFVNAQIFPKIQGYLLKQSYTDGGLVEAGDVLFEIDPRQYKAALNDAKGKLARAKAALGRSQLDVTRYTPLAAEGAISQKELDDAVQTRAANRARVTSAQAALENAQLNLAWTQVKAPISGVAAIATAQVGDLVGPKTLLTSLSQLDPIKVSFPVSEIEYLKFARRVHERETSGDATGGPTLTLTLADGSVYPHPGRYSVADLDVAQTTGTITIQGEFPNPDNLLRPGQFAKVRAATTRLNNALVIPQRAVSQMQGASFAAVVDKHDKVALTRVELGPQTGSDVVVTKGLAAGNRVIVEGLQKVRNGVVVVSKTAEPPGHEKPAPAAAH